MKFISLFILLLSASLIAQVEETSELFKTLKSKDSLLFDIGFNTCDLSQFEVLVTDDLEFYHDLGGILKSKEAFLEITKNGICKEDDYVSRRELLEGSLKVFPLYNNGVLYGAIQIGEHRFFEKPKGKPETKGSTAKFTHLWLFINEEWLLSRILSFDHVAP
ncbi:uncharacterized protein DUF4440 [Ulvibacter sp. MAR_2010_11]|uniref:nuclear transport factor 2 family protein n=1 Tax=Ulvibacter sp. MAR_2010_11 TaxID=1250229 RepID=UPI000C2B958A|nr:nuclear transport factor 2 family protein [Ulvibacter sp. MAR_2010_11]PKA83834.1 uncharacterized protein DUF4440 [Ulvibacter sp. MAR_2010_11]